MYSLEGKYSKALVTGGAGFIGSHIVESLLRDGLEVISVDDFSAGKEKNLESCRAFKKFSSVCFDVTQKGGLLELFEGVDIVFHEACSKNTVCLKDPLRDLEVNATGTLNVLSAAREAGVKKFVHASTGSVYGEPKLFPSNESHPLDPVSYYGVSKLAGDRYANLFHHQFGMDITILRYYHVFGPRQDNSEVGGVVSIFGTRAIKDQPLTIYGDGTQLRSFTFVEDIVNINKFVAITPAASGQAFNCASGVKVTIQELAEAVLAHFGKRNLEIQYQDWKIGDIKRFDVDNSKLTSLGFQFANEFEEGLAKTMESLVEFLEERS